MLPGLALAGPNEGGTLILHANPSIVFTSDTQNYCGLSALDSCAAAVTSVDWDPGKKIVFQAIAAFPTGSSPRLKGLSFGIDYDPAKFVLAAHGTCADFEVSDSDWPAPNTGTGQTWTTATQTDLLVDVYWFAGYAYAEQDAEDSTSVALIPHPTQGGAFVDDAFPAASDTIAAYGVLGFGTAGALPCPTSTEDLIWVPSGDTPGGASGETDGDEGENGEPDSPGSGGDGGVWTPPDDAPRPRSSKTLGARFAADLFTFDHYRRDSALLGSVQFQDVGLRETLRTLGVVSLKKVYPGFTPADTIRANLQGQAVRIPDLSGCFYLEFEDSTAALAALPTLRHEHGVCLASIVPSASPVSTGELRSNDPLFEDWPACPDARSDAQWYLDNDGIRAGYGNCGHATSGADVRLPWTAWPLGSEASDIIIGHIDVGIRDDHPDLNVINPLLTPQQRDLLTPWPDSVDFCGQHGTGMAGPEAARTNNFEGIAGVCSGCSLLDINVAAGTPALCYAKGIQALQGWGDPMLAALEMSLPGNLVAFNVECGDPYYPYFVEAAWTSFLLGVPVVAPSADRTSVDPDAIWPASMPWVLGVGGSTWDGRFWTHKNACLIKPDSVAVDHQPGTTIGPNLVKICAPADGSMVTSIYRNNLNCDSLHLQYGTATGQCSMAAALVTGAIGFLQAQAEFHSGHGWLSSDDVVGILTASAVPFSEDPYTDPQRECPSCPRECYGPGVLNVEGALQLLRMRGRWEQKEAGWNADNVVSRAVEWHDFQAWEDDSLVTRRAATITLTLQLHPTEEQGLPAYCAWVRRVGSRSFERIFGPLGDENNLDYARDFGITGGTFGIIDQANGLVVATGVTFGIVRPGVPGGVDWVIPPEELMIRYVNVIPAVTGVATDQGADRGGTPWRLQVASPFHPSGAIMLIGSRIQPQRRSLSITDVGGRVRRRFVGGTAQAGAVRFTWDGHDDSGEPVPSGVYWAVAEVDGSRVAKRMLVIR